MVYPEKEKYTIKFKRRKRNNESPRIKIFEYEFYVNDKSEWKYRVRGLLEGFFYISRRLKWNIEKELKEIVEAIEKNRKQYSREVGSVLGSDIYLDNRIS